MIKEGRTWDWGWMRWLICQRGSYVGMCGIVDCGVGTVHVSGGGLGCDYSDRVWVFMQ